MQTALPQYIHRRCLAVAILDLSTEKDWVPGDLDKIEELSFQYIIMVHKIELKIVT